MKTKILLLSIHAEGEKIDGADYAIVLLNDKARDMLKGRMELVKTLKKQDADTTSVNFFGEPDIIISAEQFEDIFGDDKAIEKANRTGNLSEVVELDTEALEAIKSQTEVEDGLRLGSCDLRVYDDNFRWYLFEKHSGVEMFTNETMADALD